MGRRRLQCQRGFALQCGAGGRRRRQRREPSPASTYGRPDVEVLLAAAPTLLVKGAGTGRRAGLQDNVERHRLVQRYWDGARTLTVRQSYYVCGTPFVADAISGLRGELQAAARQVQAPLPFAAGKTL
ncbi:hypothetical protein ACFSHP_11005 [Novosphingobium panipatense]